MNNLIGENLIVLVIACPGFGNQMEIYMALIGERGGTCNINY